MHGFVASGCPTRALLHAHRVIRPADQQTATRRLLKVTLQTKVRVAHRQHLGVDAAVRVVTSGAAFAHGFVLEHMRTALRRMALETTVILRKHPGSP